VYELLGNKERDLQLAATIGKGLLQENKSLADKHESVLRQHATRVEELEQEVYRLQVDLKSESSNKVRPGLACCPFPTFPSPSP
jgi:hypothetical protein